MTSKTIETTIHFGGFYESIHSHIIEGFEEQETEYFNERKHLVNLPKDFEIWEHFDFKKIHDDYIKKYCSILEQFIFDEYRVNISFHGLKLHSPRFYNYSTDTIETTIKRHEAKSLNNVLIQDDEFLKYLKKRTTSYSGYYSNYSYDEALNNKNNILISYVLEFISDQLNRDELYYKFEYIEIALNDEGNKIYDEIFNAEQIEAEYQKNQLRLAI